MEIDEPTIVSGNRTATVGGKVTPAEKEELERLVKARGITMSDALREGLLLYLALHTFTPPDERAAAAKRARA